MELKKWFINATVVSGLVTGLVAPVAHVTTVLAEDAQVETADEATSLEDWEGTWNNMGAYLDKDEIQKAFDELAEKEGVTPEEAKKTYEEKRHCDFNGLVVEGDTVKFLDKFEDEEGHKVISESEYEFVENQVVEHGSQELTWSIFKAKDENADYKFLCLMEVHGEEALTHFHLRYGDTIEEAMADDSWYPTFVKPSSTTDQIITEITE